MPKFLKKQYIIFLLKMYLNLMIFNIITEKMIVIFIMLLLILVYLEIS